MVSVSVILKRGFGEGGTSHELWNVILDRGKKEYGCDVRHLVMTCQNSQLTEDPECAIAMSGQNS